MKGWFLAFLAISLMLTAGQVAAAEATYVGSETCANCHEEISATHAKSLHGQAWAALADKYSNAGCESCHGPGSIHAETNDKADIVSFGKEAAQGPEAQAAQCLNCHVTSIDLAFWDISKHNGETACADCHDVHSAAAPKVAQPDTCFECHKDVRRDANKQSHHPIVEGKVSCSDCHNPHGSMEHGMLRADSRNQLCYKCHAEKRGPYVWEHPPVEENCGTCHEPHGSRHNKLMTEKLPNLCQNCHNWTRHPSTHYTDVDSFTYQQENANRTFVGRACLNCHPQIHGSNAGATSGMRFTR